jgi:ferritin
MKKEELIPFKNFKANENFSSAPEVEIEVEKISDSPMEELKSAEVIGVATPRTLPEEVETLLNTRLGDEYTAYYFYRNATNWCKNANYKKAAAFFESEYQGELEHSKAIQDYLTQWNLIPRIPEVPTFVEFTSLIDIINRAYSIEYGLLEKYSGDQRVLYTLHPATFNFIQKYVDIQNGEVEEYSDLLNALCLIDINNKLDILVFEERYF